MFYLLRVLLERHNPSFDTLITNPSRTFKDFPSDVAGIRLIFTHARKCISFKSKFMGGASTVPWVGLGKQVNKNGAKLLIESTRS